MTSTIDREIETFCSSFPGETLTSHDPGYDQAREVWNGEIDHRPRVIVRCSDSAEVAAAIGLARDTGLEISVRGGGHNFGGVAVCVDGLMIDLSQIRYVSVDPVARTAHCGGGGTWADVDSATQEHGLAVPGGTISHTGIGGLTLGGGFGWLTNQFGLSCDNLLSAEIVTADGSILRASEEENSDLFWALRGGGGNFGVVTDFEFRLHPVGPMIQLGLFFWGSDHGTEALQIAREITENLPRTMGAMIAGRNAPPAPFVPDEYHFTPGYALIVAGFGELTEHAALVKAVRSAQPPLFDLVTPMPYVELQRMLDDAAPWGILGYEKALYLDTLSDDVIAVVTDQLPRKSSPMSFVPIFPMGGAYQAVDDDATAFGGSRDTGVIFNMTALAPEADQLARDRDWVRGFWTALAPLARASSGYVNFMNEYDDDRVRAAYGDAKYQRLARIKAQYDPENLFHLNPNIKPAIGG
jgi:FAD/FMN-containing dehydrogenase